MSKKSLIAAILTCGVAGALLASPVAAAERCLEVNAIKSMHVVDDTSMIVKATHDRQFLVRFTGACHVGGAYGRNHFVYNQEHVGYCLNANDALPTSELGPCFVKSVTPIEKQRS